MLKEVIGAAIDGLSGYDMVSRLGEVEDRIGHGSRAGGQRERTDAAFQGCNALFQHIEGGIGQPAVDIAGILQAETGRGVLRIAEYIRRGLVDRDGTCIGRGIGLLLAHMELECFKTVITVAHIVVFYCFSVCKGRSCSIFKQGYLFIWRNHLFLQISSVFKTIRAC